MLNGRVRVSCNTCGPVQVRCDEVTLASCVETAENMFRFRCPNCSAVIVKDAGPDVVTLLMRAGVNVERWAAPDDRPDPTLGPVSDAELIAFRIALDDWSASD